MNVLLLQPPENQALPRPQSLGSKYVYPYAIDWNLLCLHAFLKGHTRHHCHIIDFRLSHDCDQALNHELKQLMHPGIVVVYCTTNNLGEARTLLNLTRKKAPHVITALCGPFPSAFPKEALQLNLADYYLAGDPEPILRNLLDFIDIPQRLKNTPGLLINKSPAKPPYWLSNLNTLSLPDWKDTFWSPYQVSGSVKVTARLSRGMPTITVSEPQSAPRFEAEPLREWNISKMTACFQKCGHVGISKICLDDPPEFWTPWRINHWCAALRNAHNTQDWQIQLRPQILTDELCDTLSQACCRCINFILPTAQLEATEHPMEYDARDFSDTLRRLENMNITAKVVIQIGGPNAPSDEIEQAVITAKYFTPDRVIIAPVPYHMETPVFHRKHTPENDTLQALFKWLDEPWTLEKPVLFWGGNAGVNNTQNAIQYIQQSLVKGARHHIRNFISNLSATRFIRQIEDKALELLIRRTSVDNQ